MRLIFKRKILFKLALFVQIDPMNYINIVSKLDRLVPQTKTKACIKKIGSLIDETYNSIHIKWSINSYFNKMVDNGRQKI